MPQIGPDIWKVASEFYWCREYRDGRIEREFDAETGEIRLWGLGTPQTAEIFTSWKFISGDWKYNPEYERPSGKRLVRVGWLPMTPQLARLIQAHGEFGRPTPAPSVFIDLKPDELLICEKDCGIIKGYQVSCKACGASFKTTSAPEVCPKCGAQPSWKCDTCDGLQELEVCPKCQTPGRKIDPFAKQLVAWEDVVYHLGVKGKFLIKFNGRGFFVEH